MPMIISPAHGSPNRNRRRRSFDVSSSAASRHLLPAGEGLLACLSPSPQSPSAGLPVSFVCIPTIPSSSPSHSSLRFGVFARDCPSPEACGQKQGDSSAIDANSQNGRRPKTSLNELLDLLSCGVARTASIGEKRAMENRRKCSKILEKWKQVTSIALRTTAHCAGPEVRTTYLGIKGAHMGSEVVRSDQKRVDVSVAKKSFLPSDLRRFAARRCRHYLKPREPLVPGTPSTTFHKEFLRRVPSLPAHPRLRRTFSRQGRRETTQSPREEKAYAAADAFSPVSALSPRCNWSVGELKWRFPIGSPAWFGRVCVSKPA